MTFLYLNSDQLGVGKSGLGRNLLKSFLSNLLESNHKIDIIGCVNSAIHLTSEGSQIIEILKAFEHKGTEIASCGTCLEFYGKKEKLLVGRIGTMQQSVEIMMTADKIIKPC